MSSTPQTDWSILVTLPSRSDIPRASDVITECCGSVLMSGVTYEYGRLRVEVLAGVADPAAQVAKWRAMEEAYSDMHAFISEFHKSYLNDEDGFGLMKHWAGRAHAILSKAKGGE